MLRKSNICGLLYIISTINMIITCHNSYYFLLCWFLKLAVGRYCQLSGYNLENQFSASNNSIFNEYHLILCIDGKFIFDTKWPEIPWSTPFKFADRTLVLSRSERYALRRVPIYLPNIEIGGLFDISDPDLDPIPITPLLSTPITNYWVEIRHDGLFVYHIPLLHTPTVMKEDWYANILVNESYHVDVSSAEKRPQSTGFINNRLYNRLIDLVVLQKKLSTDSLNKFLYKLNKLLP